MFQFVIIFLDKVRTLVYEYHELLGARLLYPTGNKRLLVTLVKWERYSHRMESV